MSGNSIQRNHIGARMSKSVVHQGTVYLCGQTPDDNDGNMTVQTEQTLAKVDALLEEVGASREHMLSATIIVSDMREFAEMNAVWDAWVPEGHAPARACIEAPMAHPDIKVEVCIIAALK